MSHQSDKISIFGDSSFATLSITIRDPVADTRIRYLLLFASLFTFLEAGNCITMRQCFIHHADVEKRSLFVAL